MNKIEKNAISLGDPHMKIPGSSNGVHFWWFGGCISHPPNLAGSGFTANTKKVPQTKIGKLLPGILVWIVGLEYATRSFSSVHFLFHFRGNFSIQIDWRLLYLMVVWGRNAKKVSS